MPSLRKIFYFLILYQYGHDYELFSSLCTDNSEKESHEKKTRGSTGLSAPKSCDLELGASGYGTDEGSPDLL